MTRKAFGQGDPDVSDWVENTFHPEDEVLREIRARGEREGLPAIAVGAMDGLHLEVLTRAIGARRAVEIGTLGGYSGVCILRGLAPGGTLDTFEYSPKHAEVARESFRLAGFADRARIHVGAAVEKLRELKGEFDLVFIDADKPSYPAYLDWAAEHLRVGGVVLADNTLAWGEIHTGTDEKHEALRKFDQQLAGSKRFRATMIPTGEGLAMGVKIR
jgi:caffeoyl-CoA O-methyltransferase